jgi:hypothetical protein
MTRCSSNPPNVYPGGALSRTGRETGCFDTVLFVHLVHPFRQILVAPQLNSALLIQDTFKFILIRHFFINTPYSKLRRTLADLWIYFKVNGKLTAFWVELRRSDDTLCYLFELVNIPLRIIIMIFETWWNPTGFSKVLEITLNQQFIGVFAE